MSAFATSRIVLTDTPDDYMIQTALEVLELTPADWNDIADALEFFARMEAMNTAALKRIRGLAKDIRSEVLAHLPEEPEHPAQREVNSIMQGGHQ